MFKKLIFIAFILTITANLLWANHTRMSTLMTGDYLEDVIYTDLYPQRLLHYTNYLYLDIQRGPEDYGLIVTPDEKYGALACWQNPVNEHGFNIGYAINIAKFDLGISFSPVRDNIRFGIGAGRTFFDQRIDLAFLTFDGEYEAWHKFILHYSRQLGDFNIVPKYELEYSLEPFEASRHQLGMMVQRMILNEGFVFFTAEYDFRRGDREYDRTHLYAGVEMKLSRHFVLRGGVAEHFENGFEDPTWHIEPGFGVRIRDFNIDFHVDKDRLFDKDLTFIKSVGLDFHFGRF